MYTQAGLTPLDGFASTVSRERKGVVVLKRALSTLMRFAGVVVVVVEPSSSTRTGGEKVDPIYFQLCMIF